MSRDTGSKAPKRRNVNASASRARKQAKAQKKAHEKAQSKAQAKKRADAKRQVGAVKKQERARKQSEVARQQVKGKARGKAQGATQPVSGQGKARDKARDKAQPVSGQRIGDLRRRREREDRAARAKKAYQTYVLRIALVAAAVLVVVFGAVLLYRSDFLHVQNVKVNGISHMTDAEITAVAAVPDDSTLLRLDEAGIIGRLEDNAWIQEASIRRVFPDTIEIDVVERAAGAVVRIDDKTMWVVSSDGIWLSAATDADWESQMRIIDVSASLDAPVSGSSCNDGGIENALAILAGISDELKAQIDTISAESSIKTSLNLTSGIVVAFGDSSDIELKESVINELLEQYAGKISYINVRVPSRPTYRTL